MWDELVHGRQPVVIYHTLDSQTRAVEIIDLIAENGRGG